MKVILLKDIPKVGKLGEEKNVTDGYARNFLLVRNLADLATKSTIKKIEAERVSQKEKTEKTHKQFHTLRESLENRGVVIRKKADEKGNLYAGITEEEIIEALKATKYPVPEKLNKKMIDFPEHIKSVGEYTAKIKFAPNEEITLKLEIQRFD